MTFAIDEASLPATLSAPPMTDKDFVAPCAEHPDLQFETTAEGELIVMAPTFTDTSNFNFNVAVELECGPQRRPRSLLCPLRQKMREYLEQGVQLPLTRSKQKPMIFWDNSTAANWPPWFSCSKS